MIISEMDCGSADRDISHGEGRSPQAGRVFPERQYTGTSHGAAYAHCFMEGMKTMKILGPLALIAMLMPACSSLQTAGIRIGDTPAARIAKDSHIPGKGVAGQCLPYAVALHKKLEAAGIPSRVIVYGYEASGAAGSAAESAPSSPAANRGAHAVVSYDDGGRTYIMDNQSWAPKWIHDAEPVKMAQQFSGLNCDVKIARVLDDEIPRKALDPAFSGVQIAGAPVAAK
jgi:hypothetical protein